MDKYIIYYTNGDTQVVDAENEEDAMNEATCAVADIKIASKEFLERYGISRAIEIDS